MWCDNHGGTPVIQYVCVILNLVQIHASNQCLILLKDLKIYKLSYLRNYDLLYCIM